MATAWVREDDESWRSAPTTVRMTVEERTKLRAEAASLGLSLQQLFELRLFGTVKPRRVPGNDRIVIHPDFDDPLPEFEPGYEHPGDPLREGLA